MPDAPVPAAAVPWGTYVVGAAFLSIALAIPALAFLYFHDLFRFVVMAGPAWAGLGYGLLMRSSAARSLAIGWLTMGLVCTSVFLLFVVTMRSELAPLVVLAIVVGLWLLHGLRRRDVEVVHAEDVGSASSPAASDASLCTIPDSSPENPYNEHQD